MDRRTGSNQRLKEHRKTEINNLELEKEQQDSKIEYLKFENGSLVEQTELMMF